MIDKGFRIWFADEVVQALRRQETRDKAKAREARLEKIAHQATFIKFYAVQTLVHVCLSTSQLFGVLYNVLRMTCWLITILIFVFWPVSRISTFFLITACSNKDFHIDVNTSVVTYAFHGEKQVLLSAAFFRYEYQMLMVLFEMFRATPFPINNLCEQIPYTHDITWIFQQGEIII